MKSLYIVLAVLSGLIALVGLMAIIGAWASSKPLLGYFVFFAAFLSLSIFSFKRSKKV